jgi:tetratricopeptide (TPR) repeat protein
LSRKHQNHRHADDPTDAAEKSLTRPKKRLFTIFLIGIPFFVLALIETGLRVFHYGEDTRLFVSAPDALSDYYRVNPKVARRFFYMQTVLPAPQKDLFLKKKPDGCYRIFVLGESTTAGFPYGNNVMFPRILQIRLADAFPDRKIEVVNMGMAAISSYAMLDFMDDIIKQKPDAILVYAGHNEFYGAMAVSSMESLGRNPSVVRAYLGLERLKLFMWLRDCIGTFRVWMILRKSPDAAREQNVTLMERIVSDEAIPYQGPVYEKGKRQFEGNLRAILNKARRGGVPVLLSELVSNVRDQKPFSSADSDSSLSANHSYRRGRSLESGGRFDEAREAYLRAKDLDRVRFRAAEEFNGVIRSIGAEFGAPVVPMKRTFEQASVRGLVGDALMADHLHPNVEGYFVMADAFFDAMRRNRFISDTWDAARIRPAADYRNRWGFTPFDSVYAALCVRQLKGGWPFRPKSEANTGLSDFRPANGADSIALQILTAKGGKTIEVGHLALARRFEKDRAFEKAFREYAALVYTIPYEAMFFEGAVRTALAVKRPELALPVLEESRQFRETVFADKWIGFILLRLKRPAEAVPFLENARSGDPADPQLLSALAQAYQDAGIREKAEKTDQLLRQLAPPAGMKAGRSTGESGTRQRERADRLFNEARQMLSRNESDRALAALNESLSLHESFQAHSWISQIYLQRNDVREALPHLERAVQLKPDDPVCLYNLGAASLSAGKIEQARAAAEELEKINPAYGGLARLKAKIRQRLGN